MTGKVLPENQRADAFSWRRKGSLERGSSGICAIYDQSQSLGRESSEKADLWVR